jgi:hypothetical protein
VTIVVRPDLSARVELSKSQLVSAEMCQTASWYDIHDRRSLIRDEKLVFGSAIDAGVEQIVSAAARGADAGSLPLQAAMEVAERDGWPLPWDEVKRALEGFGADVLPRFDWTGAVVQPTVRADIAGLGPCSGHPDIILGDGSVIDVKTTSRPKEVGGSVELGFYTLLVEATGLVVPRVGYLAWIRLKAPYWQVAVVETTDELRRYAMARALAFVRARDLDAHVNDGEASPVNYTLTGGPSRGWKCPTCQYAPANGGPCEIAARNTGEES